MTRETSDESSEGDSHGVSVNGWTLFVYGDGIERTVADKASILGEIPRENPKDGTHVKKSEKGGSITTARHAAVGRVGLK